MSPAATRQACCNWTRFLKFRSARETARHHYPEFAIPSRRVRSAPNWAGAAPTRSVGYAARAKLLLAVVKNSRFFLRGSSTSARGHSFTNPVEASRPLSQYNNSIIPRQRSLCSAPPAWPCTTPGRPRQTAHRGPAPPPDTPPRREKS